MLTRCLPARATAVLGASLLLAACQDLEVENVNQPDRELALEREDDVRLLGQKAWTAYYQRTSGNPNPNFVIMNQTREATSTVGNNMAWPLGSAEPRERMVNDPVSDDHTPVRWAWSDVYEDYSSANEVLWAIHEEGMTFEEDGDNDEEVIDNTPKIRAFAHFQRGLNQGYISKVFDQGYIIEYDDDLEDMGIYELVPWQDVQEHALGELATTIEIAEQHDFTLPGHFPGDGEAGGYLYQRDLTSDELIDLAHTYKAILKAYGPRNPDEADQVDWAQVLHHAEQGIQVDSFAARTGSDFLGRSDYRMRISGSGNWMGVSHWLLGPGDTLSSGCRNASWRTARRRRS